MITLDRLTAAGCVGLALALLAPVANAKTVLDPGLWQDTESGTENGKPAKPKVTTECMSEKDAEYPEKALTEMKNNAGQQCSKMDVHRSANGFSFDMRCGDPKQFSMDMAAAFTIHDRRHYSGHIKTTVVFGGHKTTGDKKIESKWIGACKK